MKLKKQEHKSVIRGTRMVIACCSLLLGAWSMQSCEDEYLLTGQPSWLGNSIYEQLATDGHYTNLLHLIDDLNQKEVLSHTGSKTIFAANDSAFQAWYGHNNWGVSNYDQLSTAQKKLLLNNAMINNAYLIELLSNVSGTPPMEGMCMRRETASTIYDSVFVMKPSQMPNTPAWQRFKENGKSIPIFKDATPAPMIHFLPAFMSYYNITNEDLSILTNNQANSTSESWVNGKHVVEKDITCKNGYIQKVDGVIESSPNMAEILRQHANMSNDDRLKKEYGDKAIMDLTQKQLSARYYVFSPDEMDDDDVIDMIEKTPAYKRKPDFRNQIKERQQAVGQERPVEVPKSVKRGATGDSQTIDFGE